MSIDAEVNMVQTSEVWENLTSWKSNILEFEIIWTGSELKFTLA